MQIIKYTVSHTQSPTLYLLGCAVRTCMPRVATRVGGGELPGGWRQHNTPLWH